MKNINCPACNGTLMVVSDRIDVSFDLRIFTDTKKCPSCRRKVKFSKRRNDSETKTTKEDKTSLQTE